MRTYRKTLCFCHFLEWSPRAHLLFMDTFWGAFCVGRQSLSYSYFRPSQAPICKFFGPWTMLRTSPKAVSSVHPFLKLFLVRRGALRHPFWGPLARFDGGTYPPTSVFGSKSTFLDLWEALETVSGGFVMAFRLPRMFCWTFFGILSFTVTGICRHKQWLISQASHVLLKARNVWCELDMGSLGRRMICSCVEAHARAFDSSLAFSLDRSNRFAAPLDETLCHQLFWLSEIRPDFLIRISNLDVLVQSAPT